MIRLWRRRGRASRWKDIGYTDLAGLCETQDAVAAADVDAVRSYSARSSHATGVRVEIVVTDPALARALLGPTASAYLKTVTKPTGTVDS